VNEPVRIAGAGPAGLTAAITLARAGRAVEVYERSADCGTRFRGDLQGIENWSGPGDALDEFRAMGLTPDWACRPFRAATLTNARRARRLTFDRTACYVVSRGGSPDSLDQALKRQALAQGVAFHWRRTLAPGLADIVATGPDLRRPFVVGKGIAFETDAPDMVVVLLHEPSAVKGYAYLMVSGGSGCICVCLFDRFPDAARCLRTAVAHLAPAYGVRIAHPRALGGLGHCSGRPRFQEGRTRFAGEAAGLQDLMWGFGIRTAMRSGHLAARSLLEGTDYAEASQPALRSAQRAGVVNRVAWELLRHGDYAPAMAILAVGGLGLLRSWYGFNPLQRLLFAPARVLMRRRYPALGF
jgi:hypothetical protein